MKHIGDVTVAALKQMLPPELYYRQYLQGSFGKKTGKGWYTWNGLCPFHADKRPGSFVVNRGTGAFRCFSCGAAGGDIIDFHCKRYGLTFRQTMEELRGGLPCVK